MADSRRDLVTANDAKTSGNKDKEKIRAEVDKLAAKGTIGPREIQELYAKYGDEVAESILRLMEKRHQKIKKQARYLANKINSKYKTSDKPLHEILRNMLRYKTKHGWSSAEFDQFRKELSHLLTGRRAMEIDLNQNMVVNRSRINRAIGNAQVQEEPGLNIKESEHGVLSEILSMYEKNANLHRTAFMHSLMYEDCSLVALTGEYKRERHIASNHIHPLIACMFIPKFGIFETHMIHSNFGSIIKTRYEKKPIVTEADSYLYYDIITDPNDVVCEINSAMADLKNRYIVQIKLWELVLILRSGNYYEATPVTDFMMALNACRNNLYDNADLAFTQDEGSMMRRLLSVFSFRPTFIYTKPLHSISTYAAAPMGLALNPNFTNMQGLGTMGPMSNAYTFNNQPVYTVTSIPMITLQIPSIMDSGAEPLDIRTAITQSVWINENKTLIPKEQTIIYSKEVLIFYVNRRIQRVNIRTFANPLTFSQLPLTMSNFERLNSYPLQVPLILNINNVARSDEAFQLRSVVTVTETNITQGERVNKIITGQNGLIVKTMDPTRNVFANKYYLYDPFGASMPVEHPEKTDRYFTNKPISEIDGMFPSMGFESNDNENITFSDRASRQGTIFIYAKPDGFNPNDMISL